MGARGPGSVELAPTLVADPDFSNCARRHLRGARLKDLAEIYASMTPEVDQARPDFVYRMEGVDLGGTGIAPL